MKYAAVSTVSMVLTTILSALTFLFGAFDVPFIILIVFLVLDYITGLISAYVRKEISSKVGIKGILKKLTILGCLIVAVMLDRLIGNPDFVFRTLFCYFVIANEGISILENAGEIGIPLPAKLKSALEQLKSRAGDGSGESSKNSKT